MARITRIYPNRRVTARPTDLVWEPVKSDTLAKIAYVPEYRDLLVSFTSGGTYVYRDVEPGLVAQLRKPHPWRKVGAIVKEHEFERLATIRTSPLKGRAKKTTTTKKAGK